MTGGDRPKYSIIEKGQNTEKKSWRLMETCCHSNSSEKPSAKTDVKNFQEVNNNNPIFICILSKNSKYFTVNDLFVHLNLDVWN